MAMAMAMGMSGTGAEEEGEVQGVKEKEKEEEEEEEPLLASEVVSFEHVERALGDAMGNASGLQEKQIEGLKTGCKSVDAAMGSRGFVQRGGVVAVSGEAGCGGVDICYTLLANALLDASSTSSEAFIVDSTGNTDFFRLFSIVFSRLQGDAELLRKHQSSVGISSSSGQDAGGVDAEELATKILERVKYMRVFDLTGLEEAVGEIRNELEGRGKEDAIAGGEKEEEKKEAEAKAGSAKNDEYSAPRRTVVPDSEDEEEEENDEEMLLDAEPLPGEDATSTKATASQFPPKIELAQQQDTENDNLGKPTIFLLIDNLAHVLTPLLKKDSFQAHSRALTLLQTLASLAKTKTANLQILLLNPTSIHRSFPASPKHSTSSSNLLPGQQQPPPPPPPPQYRPLEPPTPPSIFASNKAVPALMNVLAPFLDTHVLVGRMPLRKEDAGVLYGEGGEEGGGAWARRRRGVKMVGVVEVIGDRWEGREGAWGTFVVDETWGVRDI